MGRQATEMMGFVCGALTVTARGARPLNGSAVWICECLCGGLRAVRGDKLRNGSVRSCGACVNNLIENSGREK